MADKEVVENQQKETALKVDLHFNIKLHFDNETNEKIFEIT